MNNPCLPSVQQHPSVLTVGCISWNICFPRLIALGFSMKVIVMVYCTQSFPCFEAFVPGIQVVSLVNQSHYTRPNRYIIGCDETMILKRKEKILYNYLQNLFFFLAKIILFTSYWKPFL